LRTGIVVFPGTWSDRDCAHAVSEVLGQPARYVDHREERLDDLDLVILPGGFSYGDYLRCGAIARFAPVMEAVTDFAVRIPLTGCGSWRGAANSHRRGAGRPEETRGWRGPRPR